MKSLAAVVVLLLAVAIAAASASSEFKQPVPASDMPVDPRGPLLGRFAVLVYSLNRNRRMTYAGVSGVDQHADKGGVRYQMVVAVSDAGGATATFRAVSTSPSVFAPVLVQWLQWECATGDKAEGGFTRELSAPPTMNISTCQLFLPLPSSFPPLGELELAPSVIVTTTELKIQHPA
uniref:Cystatin domain-containing protein n=1 Tax=Leersia perrieri TaxID=77586 RepID=A0A0D9VQ34_9ORYZ